VIRNDSATVTAQKRHERGVRRLNSLFGLVIVKDKKGRPLPPPENVFRALLGINWKKDRPLRSKRKARDRRLKVQRQERRNAVVRRNVLRSLHEKGLL